jgi:hypothetical protein
MLENAQASRKNFRPDAEPNYSRGYLSIANRRKRLTDLPARIVEDPESLQPPVLFKLTGSIFSIALAL